MSCLQGDGSRVGIGSDISLHIRAKDIFRKSNSKGSKRCGASSGLVVLNY